MIYEFRCTRCGRRFEVYATLAEKEAGLSPACPSCGSAEVQRIFGRVMLLRSGGDGDLDADGGDAGGAGDGFGDGGAGDLDGFDDDLGSGEEPDGGGSGTDWEDDE